MKTMIIAEAGVNHDGRLDLALRLVEAAAAAGADVVKFQTFSARALATAAAGTAAYQRRTAGVGDSQLEMLLRLELPFEAFATIRAHCQALGVEFLSTPFDAAAAEFLHGLGMERFKLSSGDLTNAPLLEQVAGYGKPLLLSTGMATLGEVEAAVDIVEQAGLARRELVLLHCTSEYPAPFEDVNLRAMGVLGAAFGTAVGYSDHTVGMAVPVAAVALGARVIEKHFTLDRTMPGPDHAASLEPEAFAAMVAAIRQVERAMGDGLKRPAASERATMAVARKSIVARRAIAAGECFSAENLTVKRPGRGLSPLRWRELLGKPAPRDYAPDEPIALLPDIPA